jgi:hypothetical protein
MILGGKMPSGYFIPICMIAIKSQMRSVQRIIEKIMPGTIKSSFKM